MYRKCMCVCVWKWTRRRISRFIIAIPNLLRSPWGEELYFCSSRHGTRFFNNSRWIFVFQISKARRQLFYKMIQRNSHMQSIVYLHIPSIRMRRRRIYRIYILYRSRIWQFLTSTCQMPFENITFLSRETSSKCWCKFCCWVGGRFSRFVVIRARWTCSILGRWQEPTRERERDGRCDIYLYYILCVRDVHIYLYIHRERERERL
jgi:hypothetical protein